MQAHDAVANTKATRSPAKSPEPEDIPNVIDVMEGQVTQEDSLLEQSDPEIIMNFVLARDPFATTQATIGTFQEEAQVAAQKEGIATDVQSGVPLITAASQPTSTATQPTTTTEITQEFYPVGRDGLLIGVFIFITCPVLMFASGFCKGQWQMFE